jgi:hypothetical protein
VFSWRDIDKNIKQIDFYNIFRMNFYHFKTIGIVVTHFLTPTLKKKRKRKKYKKIKNVGRIYI